MHKPPRLLSQHRFARIVLWARLMLAWIARVLAPDARTPSRRRIRQRYRFVPLNGLERLVRALVIVRAVELSAVRRRRRRLRDAAPCGFRRRVERGAMLRAIAGSPFRKALKHGDPLARIQRLLAALADIDAFARYYLVPRAVRGLAKLCAILLVAPANDALVFTAAPAPSASDTS